MSTKTLFGVFIVMQATSLLYGDTFKTSHLKKLKERLRQGDVQAACPLVTPGETPIPTVDQLPDDPDGLNELAQQVAPVIYLHPKESAFPCTVQEYFENPSTSMVSKRSGEVIIPPGEVTIAEIDSKSRTALQQGQSIDWYFNVNSCVFKGSNPLVSRDASDTIRTPVYFLAFDAPEAQEIIIQYLFFYGYNPPYNISFAGIPLFTGDQHAFQGAHEADLEHITYRIDRKTKKIIAIFLGAHGSHEGMWIAPHELEIDAKTGRPVIYAARGAHGLYPKPGTYVRILGYANDVTARGLRWDPQLVRIYEPYQRKPDGSLDYTQGAPGYNPTTMGWLAHAGDYGKRGVSGASQQWWFGKQDSSRRTFKDALYCSPGDDRCIAQKSPFASIPGHKNSAAEQLLVNAWSASVNAGLAVEKGITNAAKSAYEHLKHADSATREAFNTAFQKTKETSQHVGRKIEDAAKDTGKAIQKTAEKAWDETKTATRKVEQFFKGLF